jgi:hypothetical protein
MPWFGLHPTATEYEVAPGNWYTAHRATLRVEVGWNAWLTPYCFFDTGAPFSVVSQTVGLGVGSHFVPIPVTNNPVPRRENGNLIAPAPPNQLLTWWDPVARVSVPCVFGELTVRLRNRQTRVTSDPLRLVAKVLQAPAMTFNGDFILLGMHFLTANTGRLHVEGQLWGLGGPGLFFPP